MRTFELSAGEVGLRLGLMVGIAGLVGTLGFGYLTDRLGRRDRRFYCWMPAIAASIGLFANFAAYSATSIDMTFLLLIVPLIVLPASGGPVYAAVQSVVPAGMRATAAAVLLLVVNLVGLGLGPSFVGLMSDLLTPTFGTDALRYAMLAIAGVYVVSATAAYLASRFFVADLARLRGE